MAINLYDHQKEAVDKLSPGSILCGGVGTGKSITALAYYIKNCKGNVKTNGKGSFVKMAEPKDLYIITTAKKRDSLDWESEAAPFMISTKRECSLSGVQLKVDSWNNIAKYTNIKNAFFIFDEQRLIGAGKWVKSFIKIAKHNTWILLSATPGDTWSDYIPVFVANKFFKNRTEFLREHAVYSRYTKYPKIEKFIGTNKLVGLRNKITVVMHYQRLTVSNTKIVKVKYDKEKFDIVLKTRWNIYKNKPVKFVSELFYLLRKIVNQDPSRIVAVKNIFRERKKIIVFYNFDYELEMLKTLGENLKIKTCEWNGHKHEEVPKGEEWLYLVQYTAGAEGWNCIETDTIVFYSQNYSYKIMVQSAGRIDRLNTSYRDLYYYHLMSNSQIDLAIALAIKKKKIFNIKTFVEKLASREKHML